MKLVKLLGSATALMALFATTAAAATGGVGTNRIPLDPVVGYRVYSESVRRNTMTLTIGDVAKRAAVGQETIRFYERQGLIPKPPRTISGYRQYPADTVPRLRFIHRAKQLGFSLKEIAELISLRLDEATCRADVRRHASEKIRDLDDKIRDLQAMRLRLVELQAACLTRDITDECPILNALQSEDVS